MNDKNKILYKIILCLIYILIIGVLFYSAFLLFTEEDKTFAWKDAKKTNQYTYLEITQMSEAFAKIEDKQFHFVMEKESTGKWHTYLVAIKKEDYNKYKKIIDYTYERIKEQPEPIIMYGYPLEIPKEIKKLSIENITKFVPIENKIKITEKNYEKYLTNTYLDTTKEKTHAFNYYVLTLLLIALVILIIIIYTIFEKNNKSTKEIKANEKKK